MLKGFSQALALSLYDGQGLLDTARVSCLSVVVNRPSVSIVQCHLHDAPLLFEHYARQGYPCAALVTHHSLT